MSRFSAGLKLATFMAFTLPLMPFQALLVKVWPWGARTFPHWYHRKVCRIIGVRLNIEGDVSIKQPVLLISNHTSWLDIPVLSAVAPVSFVAKKQVATWPFVSWLAKLQRSVFVDRERRVATGSAAAEISERLKDGDTIVLFAEGTSSDGNRVLPFLSSLFGAVSSVDTDVAIQTLAVVYTRHHGVPFGRDQRPHVSWYGDMEMTSHAWALLGSGPIDVSIRISEPVMLSSLGDRKALASTTERLIREDVVRILRSEAVREPLEVTVFRRPARRKVASDEASRDKWR